MQINLANKIELWPIEKLRPYERNARTHSEDQIDKLCASILEFGWTNPMLVDANKGILAGHGRLAAAKKLGMAEVPVIELTHLTDAQRRALILADNRIAQDAGWDEELLSKELIALQGDGFDLSLTGFNDDELAELLDDGADLSPEGDPDEVPEQIPDPKVAQGEVYVLGKHRLMCGDSTLIDHVEKLMDGQKADMVFTDPPYNIAYEGGTKKRNAIANDSMESDDFYQFMLAIYTNLFANMNPGASIYVSHADSERVNFTKAFVDAGFHLSSVIIWAKNNATFGRQDYFWKHEPVLYGWHSGGAHNFYGPNNEETVWNIDRPSKSEEHPTMKPIALMERALTNSSKKNQLVLDLFGGSGSTLIACENLGRQARLMELDPRYCQVILDRWEKFTGKKAVREDGVPWSEIRGAE